jgi:DNA repair protein RadC
MRIVTSGLVNRTIVHPREVFADIITDRATSFVCAHNHTSTNSFPSEEDNVITKVLANAANILGISFLDHVIFNEDKYYSYRIEQSRLLNCDAL